MLSEMQKKSLPHSKNVVFAALVVIGTMVLYKNIIVPHTGCLQTTKVYASATNKLAKKSSIIQTNIRIRKKNLQNLKNNFEHIRVKLFNPIEAEEFFSDIQAMAQQANCFVSSLNFSAADTASQSKQSKAKSHINSSFATMSIAGSYKNILAMINKLQDRSRQVWVDSINIEPVNDSSDLLKCDIKIRIYVIYSDGSKSHD